MKKILLIEDEPDMAELVRYNLEKDGFKVESADRGEAGLEKARRAPPDLVILDLMLPGVDGLDVLRRLRAGREAPHVPVILLTAKAGEADRVVGLELGADDYVVKPFSPRELVARVKAILRRTERAIEGPPVLRAGPIVVDSGKREVTVEGVPAPLTATEFDLLRFLAERPGRALTRNELIDGALGEDAMVTDRVIDAHIAAVRKKLGERGAAYVETIRGYGYRFRDDR
jgi:two-component system alkaline phosphatase synthesis response regulator PhoP